MRNVIGFAGLAGSGKTTAANYLVGMHHYSRRPFAAPLKAMLKALGLTREELEGRMKSVPIKLLMGKTPRQAMQTLGTEWGRECIDPEFWGHVWQYRMVQDCQALDNVVADDVRFPEEANRIRAMGGMVIRVLGRGGDCAPVHASERPDLLRVDGIIYNTGSIADLENQVHQFHLNLTNRNKTKAKSK